MTDLFSLEGRVAIVTGGAGQLGAAIVRGLEERGARVAVFDLATDEFRVDVTDRAAIEQATNRVAAEWGEPDILVNAAALDSPPDAPPEEVGPLETYPEASFDRVMDVNVKGTFLSCQVVGARMAAAKRGAIVNISSIYGMLSPVQDVYDFRRARGETFFKPVAYSVSKSALYNLTRYLATYWARSGVRVNTLTLAGVWNEQPSDFVDAYTARMPIGRMADAAEVVGPVVFLVSDASSYVTGANLVADGGWSAW
jgi:NAD(P)-dependent dehydrogenase (short-subunit alcohol dehydrogenase family)